MNDAQPSQRHVPELDGIRGWACLSVLIAHCITGIMIWPDYPLAMEFAERTLWLFLGGVDLFFVLSGFLIGGILIDQKGQPHYFQRFWIRRVARIFPVAYLLLLSYVIALHVQSKAQIPVLNEWLFSEPRPPLWSFATFTQNFFFAFGTGGPKWMGITWSLAIEEQFYLVFPFVVYFVSKRNLALTVLAGICTAPVLRDLLERVFVHWYGPYTLLPSRMDGLLFGVAVAMIVRGKDALAFAVRYRLVLDLIALIILAMIFSKSKFDLWPSPIGSPFPPLKQSALALLWALVILRVYTWPGGWSNRIWLNPVLGKIGLISYGLYMYHQSVNGLAHGLLFDSQPRVTTWAQLMVGIAVIATAMTLAAVSYVYFETPIRKFGHRLSDRLKSRRESALPAALPEAGQG